MIRVLNVEGEGCGGTHGASMSLVRVCVCVRACGVRSGAYRTIRTTWSLRIMVTYLGYRQTFGY